MKLVLFLAFLFQATIDLAADHPFVTDYRVQGRLSYQVHDLGNGKGKAANVPELVRSFDVIVSGCKWQITTKLDGNTNYDYFLYSFDETNIFYYVKYAATVKKPPEMQRLETRTNDYRSVLVERQNVPRTMTSAAGEYVWLAYASGCVFGQASNGFVLDFQTLPRPAHAASRRTIRSSAELSVLPPYLPTAIRYWNDPQAVFSFPDKTTAAKLPVPGATTGTNLAAKYSSGVFTNVAGISLPVNFEYVRYAPNAKRQELSVLTVRGQLTNFTVGAVHFDESYLGGKVRIQDLRLSDPGVKYQITNGILPSVASAQVENAKVEARTKWDAAKNYSRPIVDVEKVRKKRVLLIAFFVGSTMIAAYLLSKHVYSLRRNI